MRVEFRLVRRLMVALGLALGAAAAPAQTLPYADTVSAAPSAAPASGVAYAPPAADEDVARAARTPADVDHLEVGLSPGADLDQLERASLEELIEAALVAADQADPETAAIIRDEIERRRSG